MKKFLITFMTSAAIFLMLTITAGAALFEPAPWAEGSFDKMISMGAVPEDIVFSDYEGNIYREEFARLIYEAYNRETGTVYTAESAKIYTDVYGEDEALSAIYELGIMQGDDSGEFRPYAFITRQETAIVLNNFYAALNGQKLIASADTLSDFEDNADIADWARDSVNAAVTNGLMSDYGDNAFHPYDNVTVNQAVSIVSRMINAPRQQRAQITSPKNGDVIPSDQANIISWQGNDEDYNVYILNNDGRYVYNTAIEVGNGAVRLSEGTLETGKMYYAFVERDNVFSKPVAFFADSPKLQIYMSENNNVFTLSWNELPDTDEYTVTVSERRNTPDSDLIGAKDEVIYTVSDTKTTLYADPVRLYKVTVQGGGYSDTVEFVTYKSEEAYDLADMPIPETQEEAEALMQEIEINVWKIRNGEKVASKAWLTVHRDLADRVYTIFQEIFEGEEKFPIESVGGYSWRGGRSEHNWGTAIDINPDQNYCIYRSGEIVGDHWSPYEDPYSITPYGEVMRAFERHGFTWGGDAWVSTKDYMHFSYFGT